MHINLKRFGIAAGLVAALPIMISALAVSGHGPWSRFTIGSLAMVLMLLAIIALFCAPIIAAAFRDVEGAKKTAAISLGVILGGMLGLSVSERLRMYALELAGERASPLVSAIKSYERHHGQPPENLSLLVPDFIDALPDKTPPLTIIVGDEARSRFGGNSWALSASQLWWDSFIYVPGQNYVESTQGRPLKLLGDWAYLYD